MREHANPIFVVFIVLFDVVLFVMIVDFLISMKNLIQLRGQNKLNRASLLQNERFKIQYRLLGYTSDLRVGVCIKVHHMTFRRATED